MNAEDILLKSQAVRDYIAERCNSLHLDLSVLSMDVTGKKNTLPQWVGGAEVEVSYENIVKVLDIIGVKVVVQLVCTPVDRMEKDQLSYIESIKETYGKEK